MQHILRCWERQSDGIRIQENPSAAGAPPRTPLGQLTALPQTPYLLGIGWLPHPHPHPPALGPSGLACPTYTHSIISSDAFECANFHNLDT